MKICGQEQKVTLPIYGRERTFSEQELIAILEKYFSNGVTNQATIAKVIQSPTEEQWFEVKPQDINETLFQEKRIDWKQENARKLILEAFAEVKKLPEKYGKKFKTMMPKKKWSSKTVLELKQMACQFGGHNADWVEQALEWAQRICNGESWEAICNNADTASWYRLVIWKNGSARRVGGASKRHYDFSASDVFDHDYNSVTEVVYTVPLVVLYEE